MSENDKEKDVVKEEEKEEVVDNEKDNEKDNDVTEEETPSYKITKPLSLFVTPDDTFTVYVRYKQISDSTYLSEGGKKEDQI